MPTAICYPMPILAPGVTKARFPRGTTLRVSFDVFKGDSFDELSVCRYDKILVVGWKGDSMHHEDLWLRGRIVSTFWDRQERNQRYGIPLLSEGSEGYLPAHPGFYDVVQSEPTLPWWWTRASDQFSILPCSSFGKEECHGEQIRAGVSYKCQTCKQSDICGWCIVNCHSKGHPTEADLTLQGNYRVPWAGKEFACTCSQRNSNVN